MKNCDLLVQIRHAFLKFLAQFHEFRLLHDERIGGFFQFFADAFNISVDAGVLVEEFLDFAFAAPYQAFCDAAFTGGTVNRAVIQRVDLCTQFRQVLRCFGLWGIRRKLKLLHIEQALGNHVDAVEGIGTVA